MSGKTTPDKRMRKYAKRKTAEHRTTAAGKSKSKYTQRSQRDRRTKYNTKYCTKARNKKCNKLHDGEKQSLKKSILHTVSRSGPPSAPSPMKPFTANMTHLCTQILPLCFQILLRVLHCVPLPLFMASCSSDSKGYVVVLTLGARYGKNVRLFFF